jgi:glucose-1-phosphate adenylyltransferase
MHFYAFVSFVNSILAAEQTRQPGFQEQQMQSRQCMPHFLNHDFDYALILSGISYQMDFNEMIEHVKLMQP